MRLYYRTAIATFIQFVSLSLLGIANGLDSIVTTCSARGSDCVSNVIVSLLFFILTVFWFASIWVLGYSAQERRSRRLAYALIAVEAAVIIVASFNAKHHTNLLSLLTSIVDISLAVWVIVLAFRLSRSRGGRIMARDKAQRRRVRSADK